MTNKSDASILDDIKLCLNDANIDASELNALYQLIGWNKNNYRTEEKTKIAIDNSYAYYTARSNNILIGFGRVVSDGAYVTQIVDVITHPQYRNKGIAKSIIRLLMSEIRQSISQAFLIDGSNINNLYESFGFKNYIDSNERILYWDGNN